MILTAHLCVVVLKCTSTLGKWITPKRNVIHTSWCSQ